jgi:hypothetical protein
MTASRNDVRFKASRCKAVAAGVLLGSLLCLCFATPAGAVTAFWANSSANKISHAGQLEEGRGADIPIDPAYLDVPTAVAIDPGAGKVYWLNTGLGGSIGFADMDGSGAGILNTVGAKFSGPSGMALDPTAGKLYWGNSTGSSIGYAKLDGTGGGQLGISGASDEPNALVVDPLDGRIYWSNFAAGKISYANLDGTAAQDLDTSGAPVEGPTGVTIISRTGRIYWANQDGDSIGYASTNGGSGGKADFNTVVSKPVGLATGGETLFWGSRERDEIRDGNLAGCCTVSLETAGATQGGVSGPVLLERPRIAGNEGFPTLSGLRKPGSTLTCSALQWQGDTIESSLYRAPQSVSYQWLRNKQPIPGATGQTLTATKVGDYACKVSAANIAGVNTEESHTLRVKAALDFKRVTYNRKRGTATLRVAVTGAGRLDLFGKGVANVSRKKASGTAKLVVRSSGKARIKLKNTGKAKIGATVSYTPEGGKAIKRRKTIVLKKKLH